MSQVLKKSKDKICSSVALFKCPTFTHGKKMQDYNEQRWPKVCHVTGSKIAQADGVWKTRQSLRVLQSLAKTLVR